MLICQLLFAARENRVIDILDNLKLGNMTVSYLLNKLTQGGHNEAVAKIRNLLQENVQCQRVNITESTDVSKLSRIRKELSRHGQTIMLSRAKLVSLHKEFTNTSIYYT